MLALYIFEYTKLFVFFKWNYNIITFLKFKRDYHKNNVKKGAQKENLKNNVKNYIFELFKILQCKTGNEFRKSQLSEPKGEFWLFLNEWLFYMSKILVNEKI